jgi:ectoine hydroxylase-related dioxygenase (phytanoyl-CoA dioxygenase family)
MNTLSISSEHITKYASGGFLYLRGVLNPAILGEVEREISAIVERHARDQPALNQRDTYGRAFLQLTNLWTGNKKIRDFVFDRELARIATSLLQVEGVRLYHDQALYKEPLGGHTPWHCDQYYWPLATDRCITAWIPLQDTPLEMGALEFGVGSHLLPGGRTLEISDDSEAQIKRLMTQHGLPVANTPLLLGDVRNPKGHDDHLHGCGHDPAISSK